MGKLLLIILLALSTLDARENPFFPSKGEKDIPYTSNQNPSLPKLKRATISLPTQARVIKKVTIEYITLDGSKRSKSIELDNSVDWHLPIFISQSYQEQIKEKKVKKKQNFKKIASIKYANFYSSKKTLKIITEDKIIRNFLLVQPHRIVMDFQRDTSLETYVKENKNGIFSKIRIGNHDGYYRAVIELDGYYRYKMKKTTDGYTFKLR